MKKFWNNIRERLGYWIAGDLPYHYKEIESTNQMIVDALKKPPLKFKATDFSLFPGKQLMSEYPSEEAYILQVREAVTKHKDLQDEIIRAFLQVSHKIRTVHGGEMDLVAIVWYAVITDINTTLLNAFKCPDDAGIKERIEQIEASLLNLMGHKKGQIPNTGPTGQA